METNIKSSFIPRDPLDSSTRTQNYTGGSAFDLIALLCIIIAVASTALGVGMFLYVKYLETSKSSKTEQLQRAQAAFEPALIAELTRLDDRMKAGQELLGTHLAPSVLFAILEQLTLETVSFSTLTLDASEANNIAIEMRGQARSVNAIALQADLFGRHPAISSPLFSNINRAADGTVGFELSAIINPAAMRYAALVGGASQIPLEATSNQPTINSAPEGAENPDAIPGFTQ